MTTAGGRLVLVFDDGYAEDYTDVWPVLREADAPACFAIVPDWLGEPGHMNATQLAELVDGGCEVAAHGRVHRFLQAHRLSQDVAPGDRRLHLDGGHVFPGDDHGVVPGDRYELRDTTNHERRELTEKGETGEGAYIEAAEPIEEGFRAGEAVVRPCEGVLRDEVAGAGEDLREMGFEPRTFVLPYDAGDVRAWSAVERRYDALANAAVRSLPNPPGTPLTSLRRHYLETTRLARREIAEYLDAIAQGDALGVLAGHSAWESVPAERVAWVLDAAAERDIEVTTFREILEADDRRVVPGGD